MKGALQTTNTFLTSDVNKLKKIVTAKVEKLINRKISKTV